MRGFWAGLVAALLVRSGRVLLVAGMTAGLAILYMIDLLVFAARAISLTTVIGAGLISVTVWAMRKIRMHDRQYTGRHRKGWAR